MSGRRWQNAKLTMLNAVRRAKRQMMGRHVEALLVKSKNGLFLVDVDDQYVGRKLSYNGEYGLDELARLLSVINEHSRVLVVGSHIGTLALPPRNTVLNLRRSKPILRHFDSWNSIC